MPHHAGPALLLLATLAAACTTLTVAERTGACRATEWSSYGENDGILGVAAIERAEKFADCAALGYPADIAAYQAGRSRGLGTYCTVENGYQVGYAGRRYRDVCPPEMEPAFLQGYEQGAKERPADYYPYYGYGFGFGYYNYPYFGPRFGGRYRGHHGHRRHSRGSRK
jgi:ribosome modulation factor